MGREYESGRCFGGWIGKIREEKGKKVWDGRNVEPVQERPTRRASGS